MIKQIFFLLEKNVGLVKTEPPNRESEIRMKTPSSQARLRPTEGLKSVDQRSSSQPPTSQPLSIMGNAGRVNLVSAPDCQNTGTFLSGFQRCPSEPGCWQLWHRRVEKQLNQTWVSSYRTNASSAIFSAAREKLLFFFFSSSSGGGGGGGIERKY